MKVAVWYNNDDIRIEERPLEDPQAGELLLKIHACGICGSDVVTWYRITRAPLVPGHEIGAEVVAAGEGVERFRTGDRVFVAPKVPCMNCRFCRREQYPLCTEVKERLPGGLAEYVVVPRPLVERATYRLPGGVTYDQSTFIEPLACVVRSQRLSGVKEGDTMLVLGGGVSGLLQLLLAKRRGVRVFLTDIVPEKLRRAADFGADGTIDADSDAAAELRGHTGGKANCVMVCTSALSAVYQAWECVEKGGVVVFFAVPGPEKEVKVPLNDFWQKEMRILTSYYCGPPDLREALELIASGTVPVGELITHRLPLEGVAEGFQLVREGTKAGKVVIRPHGL